jgi:hypothetical protein
MSTLVAQTLSNGTVSTSTANCIQGSAKSWVNFNGDGGITIRASYNVSSVTRNAAGQYTINFTNAFADTNYSVIGLVGSPNIGRPITTLGTGLYSRSQTTTATNIYCVDGQNATTYDADAVCVSVFR